MGSGVFRADETAAQGLRVQQEPGSCGAQFFEVSRGGEFDDADIGQGTETHEILTRFGGRQQDIAFSPSGWENDGDLVTSQRFDQAQKGRAHNRQSDQDKRGKCRNFAGLCAQIESRFQMKRFEQNKVNQALR